MRNYIKMRVAKVHVHSMAGQTDFYAWGDTDAEINSSIAHQQIYYKQTYGDDATFVIFEPQVVYWLLNAKNFGRLLNGPDGLGGFGPFTGTRLYSSNVLVATFYDMTRIAAEGSPRASWSHGH